MLPQWWAYETEHQRIIDIHMNAEKPCQAEEKSNRGAECSGSCSEKLGLIYGSMLLRLWLGVRAVQAGVEKFAGEGMTDQAVSVDGVANEQGLTAATSFKEYAMAHYHGVPESLMKSFQGEPLMIKWMLPLYDKVLGPALIGLGLAILLGICYRSSLFLLGLLYISLTWGLVLLKQDPGVAWLGIHMVMIVMALAMASYNRISILKKW